MSAIDPKRTRDGPSLRLFCRPKSTSILRYDVRQRERAMEEMMRPVMSFLLGMIATIAVTLSAGIESLALDAPLRPAARHCSIVTLRFLAFDSIICNEELLHRKPH
jgi:hypothetical protein